MPAANQPSVSPEVAAGLAQLSQIPANLQHVKAAGQVIVPVVARAIALLPDGRVNTANGHSYRVPLVGRHNDIAVHRAPGTSGVLLNRRGRDKHWAIFVRDLPEIVETLLENPDVQALSDSKLERLAQVLDD
jgi:hypothetical protein